MTRSQKAKDRPRINPSGLSGSPDPSRRNGYPFLTRGAAALSPAAWLEIRRGLKLSQREVELIQSIFDDKIEFAIGVDLGISVNTVRTELRRLRRKLKASDRVTLVLLVLEEFLRQTASEETSLPAICRNHSSGCCPLLAVFVRGR